MPTSADLVTTISHLFNLTFIPSYCANQQARNTAANYLYYVERCDNHTSKFN